MFGDLVTNLLWWPGADTEIVVLNDSGHDVARLVIRYAGQEIRYGSLLQARRDGDPKQNISHYKKMFFRDIKSRTFPIEITYTEADTVVTRSGSSVADSWPRGECRFVIVLEPDGAQFSECRHPEREDFNVSQ